MNVRDDSGVWVHRDEGRLREELGRFDAWVAWVVGPLGDALSEQLPAGSVRAPIREHPEFEWLEARGRAAERLTKRARRDECRRVARGDRRTAEELVRAA